MSFSDEVIEIEGYQVCIAKVDGPPNVFSQESFILVKPKWENDEDVCLCNGCSQKFTQIRRRHHCRHCGKIFCGKCCNQEDRILLKHLGMEVPERVCFDCKPIAELLSKAQSLSLNEKQESAMKLNEMCGNSMSLIKVLRLGGLQSIIYLGKSKDYNISQGVSSALHTMAQNMTLLPHLAASGCISALISIMEHSQLTDSSVQNAICTINLFSRSNKMLAMLLEENAVAQIIRVLNDKSTSSFIAVQVLSQLLKNLAIRRKLLNQYSQIITILSAKISSEDQQMQLYCLNLLCMISEESNESRSAIIKEEFQNFKPLLNILKKQSSENIIVKRTTYLLANLATNVQHQKLIADHIDELCCLTENLLSYEDEVKTNIIRALANSAEYNENRHIMRDNIHTILQMFLNSKENIQKYYALRLSLRLIESFPMEVKKSLLSWNEACDILHVLCSTPETTTVIHQSLLNKAPVIIPMAQQDN